MKEEVQAAFSEMLDISTDIDKAVLFGPGEILASNMERKPRRQRWLKLRSSCALASLRATEMGSQPLTQLVVETAAGYGLPGSRDGGRRDGRLGHRQEGQPCGPGPVRPEDLSAGRSGGPEQPRVPKAKVARRPR